MDASRVEDRLGNDLNLWIRMLRDIKLARSTFDTSEVDRRFGPIIIDFEAVRDKVNHKYDSWHREFLGKFASLLSNSVHTLRSDLSRSREKLETVSFDGVSTNEIVSYVMGVRDTLGKVRDLCNRSVHAPPHPLFPPRKNKPKSTTV